MDRRRGVRGEGKKRRARVLLAGRCLKPHSVGAGMGTWQLCKLAVVSAYGAIWRALIRLTGINEIYTSNQKRSPATAQVIEDNQRNLPFLLDEARLRAILNGVASSPSSSPS